MLVWFFFFWGTRLSIPVPFGMVPWTRHHSSVDNGQCLHSRTWRKERGACQTWPHAHLFAISCLWATPTEKVLGLAWHGRDLASLHSVSKQTSFFENIEGNPVEKKKTLWPSGMCRDLSGAPKCGCFSVHVTTLLPGLRQQSQALTDAPGDPHSQSQPQETLC